MRSVQWAIFRWRRLILAVCTVLLLSSFFTHSNPRGAVGLVLGLVFCWAAAPFAGTDPSYPSRRNIQVIAVMAVVALAGLALVWIAPRHA